MAEWLNAALSKTGDTIHGVQSYSLGSCHTEGLAIFAGKEVEVDNDVFYENSVYDVFVQQSEVGVKKEPATLEGIWHLPAERLDGGSHRHVRRQR